MNSRTGTFLKAHPWATFAHVKEIESFAVSAGIPFCDVCSDWHNPDEEHSAP